MVKNISKRFKTGRATVKDFSLQAPEGSVIALLGPNGGINHIPQNTY